MSNILAATTSDNMFTLAAKQLKALGGTVSANDTLFTLQAKITALQGAGTTGGITDAPMDGNNYVRQNGVWVPQSGPPPTNYIAGYDEFLLQSWASGSTYSTWNNAGPTVAQSPWVANHQGVAVMPSSAAAGQCWLILQEGTNCPDLTKVSKAVMRLVWMVDTAFSTANVNDEVYFGFTDANVATKGALFSYAPGYVQANLSGPPANIIGGTYNGAGVHNYATTTFGITPGTWYDCILSLTSTAAKFYAATWGNIPTLIATITTGLNLNAPNFLWIGNNHNTSGDATANLYLDKAEWFFQPVTPGQLMYGQNLSTF
jgi:hypothetical protein